MSGNGKGKCEIGMFGVSVWVEVGGKRKNSKCRWTIFSLETADN